MSTKRRSQERWKTTHSDSVKKLYSFIGLLNLHAHTGCHWIWSRIFCGALSSVLSTSFTDWCCLCVVSPCTWLTGALDIHHRKAPQWLVRHSVKMEWSESISYSFLGYKQCLNLTIYQPSSFEDFLTIVWYSGPPHSLIYFLSIYSRLQM